MHVGSVGVGRVGHAPVFCLLTLHVVCTESPWVTLFINRSVGGRCTAVRWTPEAAKISPESTRRDEQLPSRTLTAARSSSPPSGLVRWLEAQKGAKRDIGCPGVPADAGLRASDAASDSETRCPHRRRPPSEPSAVGAITSVDETAGASAPAPLPRRHEKFHLTSKPGCSERANIGYNRRCNCPSQPSMLTRPELDTLLTPAHTGGHPCLGVAASRSGSTRGPRLNAGRAPRGYAATDCDRFWVARCSTRVTRCR